ncbi:MAG: tRNA threonylcarbamoyladenosine biosynthesis protein TsaE [Acidimicrobiaceae bacterium]|jgi:tRNA threonylcarbamoyladenosine biosynthesis protein TsaE|nr:tRNA threonylcarbamoyladenosine biosynthesis protein TsaE [Acidimicrobiaceae bacterium]
MATLVRPGDVMLLSGELGTGKTVLTQGLAEGLEVRELVTSPTFTLVHRYEARVPLFHLDVYRLERVGELADLGIDEVLDAGGVVVVEWGDVVAAEMPADRLEVRFAFGDDDDDRTIELTATGTRWPARWRILGEATEDWRC